MRIFLIICRILVGATFIISGLVKANDPLGFSYKLEEYFAANALGWTFFEPWSLALAILACLGEVVLGFAILVGGRMKLTTAAILVLALFFGWLTYYTDDCNKRQERGEKMTYVEKDANGDPVLGPDGKPVEKERVCVTDCGCFGDAMKGSIGRSLTPAESFRKDMVLLVFLLPVFIAAWFRKSGVRFNTWGDDMAILLPSLVLLCAYCWLFAWWFPLLFTVIGFAGYLLVKRYVTGVKAEWTTAAWITAITLVFIWWGYAHLPMRDYRPFAVGKNIPEQMKGGVAPVQNIYVIYKNKGTGEVKEFDSKGQYPWNDTVNWAYVDRRIETLKSGIEAPIKDFSLTDKDGVEVGEDILNEPTPILLIVAKNMKETSTSCQPAINELAQAAFKEGWYVYGLTNSPYEDIEEFRHANGNPFDYVRGDEIMLKTMIRSNPGVVLLQQGTVRGQWHCNDVPTLEEAKKQLK